MCKYIYDNGNVFAICPHLSAIRNRSVHDLDRLNETRSSVKILIERAFNSSYLLAVVTRFRQSQYARASLLHLE